MLSRREFGLNSIVAGFVSLLPFSAKAKKAADKDYDKLKVIFSKNKDGKWDWGKAEVEECGYRSSVEGTDLFEIISYGKSIRNMPVVWTINEGGEYPKTSKEAKKISIKYASHMRFNENG